VFRRLFVPLATVVLVAGVGAPAAAARATSGPATRALTAARPDPVLLVHGFGGSTRGWRALEASLRAQGYRADEIDAVDYDDAASNVDVAQQLAHEADALRARTGAAHVDVVTHSMGAISSRWWMERLGGAAHVDAWVSLAGVNEGTVWAYGCYVLAPCREMVPTSSMLERLNDGFRATGPTGPTGATGATRYAAWWSPCDDVIVPHTNAELPGAHNVETACLDHTEMHDDPHVLGQVVRFLGARSTRG
jgi:triacylglycerol esterase/lipase EstA (alpha/beta hydrolase family)